MEYSNFPPLSQVNPKLGDFILEIFPTVHRFGPEDIPIFSESECSWLYSRHEFVELRRFMRESTIRDIYARQNPGLNPASRKIDMARHFLALIELRKEETSPCTIPMLEDEKILRDLQAHPDEYLVRLN